MTTSSFYIIAIMALLAIAVLLYQEVWKIYLRVEHLRMAIRASKDFYDRADVLLKDPATPEILKHIIFDIGLAVSDERAGRKAVALILKSADLRHRGHTPPPNKKILNALDNLRRTRGDLYDAFNESLSAAFAAIVASRMPNMKLSKLALSYDATRNRLSLAESIDHEISHGRDANRTGQQVACA